MGQANTNTNKQNIENNYISLRKTFLQKVNIKIVNSNISLRHMFLLFNSSLPVTLKITVNFLNDCFLNEKDHL